MDQYQVFDTTTLHLDAAERLRLERILTRAEADCAAAKASAGTGAQGTRKRAILLKAVLNGTSLEDAAAAASLTPQRATRVLTNFSEHGFPALSPSFAEALQGSDSPGAELLWSKIKEPLGHSPSHYDVRAKYWTPEVLLDFLIEQQLVEDSSNVRIGRVIAGNTSSNTLPLHYKPAEQYELQSGVKRGKQYPWLGALVGVVFLGAGRLCFALGWSFFGGLFSFIAVVLFFFGLISIYRSRKEKELLRAVITQRAPAASATPALTAPQPMRSDMPEIVIRHVNTLPAPAWNVNACSASTNAAGHAPLPILYLWVFQAFMSQFVFETHGWPQLGPLHLLLNCSALPVGQLRRAKDSLLMGDSAALASMVAAYNDAADSYERPQLFSPMGFTAKTHYRGYPIHTLVCTDSLWQEAFHAVAQRSQLAVFNLSGYDPGHPGLEYEIRHVLSGGPPRRCVFVFNRHTNADGAIDSVIETWRKVPEFHDQVKRLVFLRYQDPQSVGYGRQFKAAPKEMAKIHPADEGPYHPAAAAIVEFLESIPGS